MTGPLPTGPALAGAGLVAVRGGRRVLDGADLAVRPGERLAVVGPSGAGKSTLLGLLSGLERPDEGTVRLGGTPLAELPPGELRRRVGIVLQGYGLVSLLTATENVALPILGKGRHPLEVQDAVGAALEAVGLPHRADHLVEELSGGEQQRVAIARALALSPDVLLADEPTAELDAVSRGRVLDLLLDATVHGAALVLVTHDPEVAERCDRQLRLEDGRTVAVEPAL